ncbi:MAG: 3-deoxy-D-manno-octulosonic acid transferase [Zetaproteobacteria bacterium CG12_big_fil_rev_8_21_14_0_65_54_13]|nr:MAG: 3-deoxy-D-manno-octulosonic acid transferase [Zetaproteobacteria bacterium CG23_combo_of_CG06-09_8_20_14_all_54_7]PIW44479.1 MAG: 3-deoxy-D-manno-octulosonic acid transferase [Zetaproteobacteria bacterium CG12_big_fil_rev_8_21_14_0_65_54_13]PIX55634.1 MAG: 3-deoxy-D-manno-octulosonic acid transferase [Zetaproteobacteria bacterium CG_4_10_14_3_um_filter_54_28]PJA27760.1 MAG: 3-deoxy-D-manno-octulosonic acid transferase [Zetaproteobacteria bacterium CG_4_9_14_3_um_filter_54_145]
MQAGIHTPISITEKWRQHFTLTLPDTSVGCIWLHACSVGEVASVTPLIHALLNQGHTIHLSVVTATGFAHARRLLGKRISISFLPWDLPGTMSRFVNRLQPALLLLAETEFWPGMLTACKQRNIAVIGINTRISDRSFPRYKASRWLWQRWLKPVALFLAQSDTDRARLIAIGVPEERVRTCGNLKYAITAPNVDSSQLREKADQSGRRPILLVASTHQGEDERILKLWEQWHAACPDLLMLIVPRHPERFNAVAELIRARGHSLSRWSDETTHSTADVVLVDAMGILGGLYCIADVVIVAGSLEPVGGHNPLEAAVCGRGVVTGPHTQNFRQIMTEMQQANAAIVTRNDPELAAAVTRLLHHPEELTQLHASAALFMQDKGHALEQMLAAIKPYLPEITTAARA